MDQFNVIWSHFFRDENFYQVYLLDLINILLDHDRTRFCPWITLFLNISVIVVDGVLSK